MRKGGFTLVIFMAIVAGCSSGGGTLPGNGGGSVSPGHSNPKAAVEGFLTALQTGNGGSSWSAYVNPSDQQQCTTGTAQVHITISGNFSIGNEVIQGTHALVAVTGNNLCAHDEEQSTTTISCSSNSNPNAGLPPAAGTFSQAYAAAINTNGSTTAPCVEVNGNWYIDISSLGGTSSSTTTPTTTPPTTTPATSATTTPTTTPSPATTTATTVVP